MQLVTELKTRRRSLASRVLLPTLRNAAEVLMSRAAVSRFSRTSRRVEMRDLRQVVELLVEAPHETRSMRRRSIQPMECDISGSSIGSVGSGRCSTAPTISTSDAQLAVPTANAARPAGVGR